MNTIETKPLDQMTVEELETAEKAAWAAVSDVMAVLDPLRSRWATIANELSRARVKKAILAEIKAGWKVDEQLPDSYHLPDGTREGKQNA